MFFSANPRGEISTAAGAFVMNRRRLTAGTRLADDRDG